MESYNFNDLVKSAISIRRVIMGVLFLQLKSNL